MTRILVISDTHLKDMVSGMPEPVKRELELSDLLIHAGDFTGVDLFYELNSLTRLIAVHGNMDGIELSGLLPRNREFEIENIRFGLLHGNDSGNRAMKIAYSVFENCDIIIFGHSHLPVNRKLNGVLMFNPGSPTDPRQALVPSYGIITVENDSFDAEIISFH